MKLIALWILGLMVCWLIAAAVRWLVGPMRPPAGWDETPGEWDMETAKRTMQARDE